MAIVYCYHGGSNTSPYDTWAKAATTFATAEGALSAGDDIYIAQDHSETISSTTTYSFPGTFASGNRVISVERTGSTYSKATAVQVGGTANVDMIINGGNVRFYGVYFKGPDDFRLVTEDNLIEFNDSTIDLARAGSALDIGNTNGQHKVIFNDVDVHFLAGGEGFGLTNSVIFAWNGGSLNITGTQFSNLTKPSAKNSILYLKNVDLSVFTGTLANVTGTGSIDVDFINCDINASAVIAGTFNNPYSRVRVIGADDSTGNELHRAQRSDYYGDLTVDDAIYRNTGASDGTNNISWKMVTNANAVEYSEPLKSLVIEGWIDTTGSKTFTAHLNFDSATDLDNDEVWLEVEFLGTSTTTQASISNDRAADILATPAAQATSTETWTGTGGFTNENKQQLSVTETVNRVGPFRATVYLAKPSTTIYVCPKVEIS